jgi:NADPH:quinone reductase-like Zn-dependent oxidoreductase
MKAIRVAAPGGLDRLTLGEAEEGTLGPQDIRVALHASSLNYHDYYVAIGGIPTEDGRIPMSDGAGEVLEVGCEVTAFRPGDHVVSLFFPHWRGGRPAKDLIGGVPGDRADGYARERVVAPASAFTRVPRGWSDAQAATLPCAALTAWRALVVEGGIAPGQTVLVQGSGGVSVFALQFAKMAGATVIATSSSDAKLERLKALGADHLVNYRERKDWGVVAREITGGVGVDHVVEIGGAGTLEQSIAATRMGGDIALIGVLAGFAGPVPTAAAMFGQVRITGITVGSREHQEAMIAAIEGNGLSPVIDRSFALDELAEAFRYQESGQHFGKICVEW